VLDDAAALAGAGRLIKRGDGELIRGGSSSFTGGTVVEAGLLTVTSSAALGSGPLTVAAGAAVALETGGLATTGLDVAAGGRIDLGSGRIAVAAGGVAAADLRAAISAGRGDGGWDGAAGITSGDAAASGGGWGVGYLVDAAGAVAAFAAPGDLNLDGLIDFDDVVVFAATSLYDTGRAAEWATGDLDFNGVVDFDDVLQFVSAGLYDTGLLATWAEGDYDYNGVVDFDDVLASVSAGLFDTGSYNVAPGGLSLSGLGSDPGLMAGGFAAVPEPSTWMMGVGGLACAAWGAWRRRR